MFRFTKRKPSDKIDRPPKKPKVVTRSTVEESPDSNKLPPPPRPGKGKGVMTSQGPVTEKHPILLREDSWYAIKQLLSIIKDDDYEDLGNHATEAMGEMGLLIFFTGMHICPSLPSILLLPLFSNLHF